MSRAWDKEKVQSAHEESNVRPPDYALRFPAGTHNFFRVPRSWQDEKTSFSIYLPSSKLYIPPILFTNVICNCLKVPHFQVFLTPFLLNFFLILEHIAFVLIHSYFSISCINWVDKVSRPFQALAFCQSKWRRANARNVNQETLNEGQSFDKFKSSCCYTPPPVQHYSFFRNLPPFLHPMLLMLPDYCFVPHHNLLFRN